MIYHIETDAGIYHVRTMINTDYLDGNTEIGKTFHDAASGRVDHHFIAKLAIRVKKTIDKLYLEAFRLHHKTVMEWKAKSDKEAK